ncbi:MAG TPA: YhbY family RNA-binding protein [Woeseiaceae bacterium]|nr:YhbY family RNA-binding protein [Woeseiaceae bacterium]
MPLSESHKKYLRGLGHKLKPAVTVGGAGISEALVAEFEATIAHHELVKVRVRAADREARDAAIDELARRGHADLVTRIGNVALYYRPNPERPKITLP